MAFIEVVVRVYDTNPPQREGGQVIKAKNQLMLQISFPASNELQAAEVVNFAEGGFSLANVPQGNDYYAGLRAGYLAFKSAMWFDGEPVIKAHFTGV